MRKVFIAALGLMLAIPALADEQGEAILECARTNLPTSFTVDRFVLSSRDARGQTAQLAGSVYYSREVTDRNPDGLARSVLYLNAPAQYSGSAYLIHETNDFLRDGMYVYLPAVGRVRRVTGSFADGRLFGTDLTYHDFKQIQTAFADMNVDYMGPDMLHSRATRKIRLTAKPGVESEYDHILAWVDTESCLPVLAHAYRDAMHVKTLRVPPLSIAADGDGWYPAKIIVEDLIEGSQTTIETLRFSSGEDISELRFHPATFYRGN